MAKTWNRRQAALAILDRDPDVTHDEDEEVLATLSVLQRHLDAGKGIAVYENADLGHPMLGHKVGLTYGTPDAQFEPYRFPAGPPEQLPDGLLQTITGGINWRYRLIAVVPPSTQEG